MAGRWNLRRRFNAQLAAPSTNAQARAGGDLSIQDFFGYGIFHQPLDSAADFTRAVADAEALLRDSASRAGRHPQLTSQSFGAPA